jgi:hypothetical protein
MLAVMRASPSHLTTASFPSISAIRKSNYAEPDPWQDSALEVIHFPEISDQYPGYLNYFEQHDLHIRMLMDRGEWEEAWSHFHAMERMFHFCDSLLIQARLHILGFMLTYYTGKRPLDEMGLQETYTYLKTEGLVPEQWQVALFLQWSSNDQVVMWEKESQTLLNSLVQSLDEA